jgi:hypothetical protein
MAYFHGRPAHLKNWSIFMGGLPIQKTCSIFAGGLLIFNFKLGLNPFVFSKNQNKIPFQGKFLKRTPGFGCSHNMDGVS